MSNGLIGVDIGGSGIKAGLVDAEQGELIGERVRVDTPQPAGPDAVVAAVAEVVAALPADGGPVGIGFPGAVVDGVVMTAANMHPDWIGVRVADAFAAAVGRPCAVLNDADAAGLAEVRFGEGRGQDGTVLLLTLGTGIGSALFVGGALVPNTELGHIEVRGKDGELRASAGARERKGLSYARWAPLLNEYLDRVDRLIWPDLIILGGGISRKADRFVPLLDVRPRLAVAALRNQAGIVGAALRARDALGAPPRAAPRRATSRAPARSRSRAGSAP